MIFVPDKSEKWHDELKASLSRYFKYLPFDHDSYSKIMRNLNDTFFIQMPSPNNLRQYLGASGHHEKEVIKPEIEFFYRLCSANCNFVKLPESKKVILLAAEESQKYFPQMDNIPPCFTKIPFSMESVIKEKIVSDESCCSKCDWGRKLIKFREMLYHISQIKTVWNEGDIDKISSDQINKIKGYQENDFIANFTDIEASIKELFPLGDTEKNKLENLTIYLLEDDKKDSDKIEKLLNAQGVGCVKAYDIPQGFIGDITKGDIRTNCVVLLDLVMLDEEKQGEEVCRNINHYLPLTPVFILSGKKDIFNIVNRLVGSRFEAFFQKNNLIDDNEIDENIRTVYARFFLTMILKSVQRAENRRKERIDIEYNRLGIIVAGYGDFSQRTFGNLLKTIDKMNEKNSRGIQVELLAIIEPYWAAKGAAKKRLREKGLDIPVINNIEKAREELTGYTGKIIIRDVSSSHQHVKNHKACKENCDKNEELIKFDKEIFHIVEKPIALDSEGLNVYNDDKFTSVLEEVENPAVLTVKDYIEENRLSINSLEFWRYSSIAWIQLLEGKRKGVRGGSYMDKSIHDWAVAYFLLNKPINYHDDENSIKGNIEMFMPFSCDNLLKDFPIYNFMKFDENSTDNLKEAEDLKMTSSVTLKVDKEKTVNVKMHSSWGGVTRKDEKDILRDGEFYLKGALYSKESFGTVDFKVRRHVDYKFVDQELRLGKVTCKNKCDKEITIYFNMLTRDDAGIYPFVKVIRNESMFSIPLCQRKGTSLDRIMEDSLLYFSGAKQTSKTGPGMSIFCHERALECLNEARKSIQKPTDDTIKKHAIERVQKHAFDEKDGVGVKFFWD